MMVILHDKHRSVLERKCGPKVLKHCDNQGVPPQGESRKEGGAVIKVRAPSKVALNCKVGTNASEGREKSATAIRSSP